MMILSYEPTNQCARTDQWKYLLHSWGIFKNNCLNEASLIKEGKRRLGREERWDCLVLASGILLNIREIQWYYDKHGESCTILPTPSAFKPPRRHLTFVPLALNVSRIDDPSIFKDFRRLL